VQRLGLLIAIGGCSRLAYARDRRPQYPMCVRATICRGGAGQMETGEHRRDRCRSERRRLASRCSGRCRSQHRVGRAGSTDVAAGHRPGGRQLVRTVFAGGALTFVTVSRAANSIRRARIGGQARRNPRSRLHSVHRSEYDNGRGAGSAPTFTCRALGVLREGPPTPSARENRG
jgi:hypothetical protein